MAPTASRRPAVALPRKLIEKETSPNGTLTLNEPTQSNIKELKLKAPPTKRSKPKDIHQKARIFHVLKREVLAPFLMQLALENRFQDFTKDLEDEGTLRETPDRENSPDEDDAFANGGNNSSYDDDWRKE
ncbi:unnamed protein product [Orchesella dallaii]|uniref:Uncharacterized protein n=1 Tax=Orchesella dallaii TaxID=48710 RepID=A0ABP1QJ74_9HEXA